MNFPHMIDWMDEFGMDNLHESHKTYNEDLEKSLSFVQFVKEHYETCKQLWHDEMKNHGRIDVPFDIQEGNIAVEIAKATLAQIINKGLKCNTPRGIIDRDCLAPDHNCAHEIIKELRKTVLPAVQFTLNNLNTISEIRALME